MSELKMINVPKRDYNLIKSLRERNDVKSLVIEYEHVLSKVNRCVKNMGADQSSVKPIPNDRNSLVKQRIEKFNQIDNEFKKTARSVSTYNGLVKSNTEFQRSKSVDPTKRGNKEKVTKQILNDGVQNINHNDVNRKSSRKQVKTDSPKKPPRKKSETSLILQANCDVNINTVNLHDEDHNTDTNTKEQINNENDSSNIEEEFEVIESQMQDATNAIFAMTENKIEPVFTSNVENFVITNNIRNVSFLDDYDCLDKTQSIENIDIYLQQRTSIGENEFGEICKDNLKNIDFVEAYNQTGYELLMTTVHSVTELEDQESTSENDIDSIEIEYTQEKSEAPKDNNGYDMTNGIDNALYFSKEELEVLIPDDDSEIPIDVTLSTVTESKSQEPVDIPTKENLKNTNEITIQETYLDSIKSETTIYDSFQNPRIAKVRSITKREEFAKDTLFKDDDDPSKNLECKPKIEYIVEEIITTERKYIDHLERVLEDYMPYFKSNNLAPKNIIKTVFGNIKEIYQLTQKLYRTLQNYPNYESVAKTFLRYEPLFDMYPLYFKNKPIADHYLLGEFKEIVAIRERELNDQLGLASHLLTPIQRLGKYILFLEQIRKELKKNDMTSELVIKALKMVKREMATGNDYIAVDSIKKSPVGLVQQGHFLMREKFKVLKPKKYEAVVFFFEKVIVFTTVNPKNSESFYYKDSIKLGELGIVTYDDQPLLIHLKRFPSNNSKESEEQNRYVIEAKKEKDKKLWSEEIEKRLWDQLIQCRERQQLLHNCAKKQHLFEVSPNHAKKKKTVRK